MRVINNALWLSLSRVLGDILSFVLFVAIARDFGPAGTGEYSYAFAIGALVALAASSGFEEFGVREYITSDGGRARDRLEQPAHHAMRATCHRAERLSPLPVARPRPRGVASRAVGADDFPGRSLHRPEFVRTGAGSSGDGNARAGRVELPNRRDRDRPRAHPAAHTDRVRRSRCSRFPSPEPCSSRSRIGTASVMARPGGSIRAGACCATRGSAPRTSPVPRRSTSSTRARICC